MGDMNIHHRSWLTFSCNDSVEGRRLKEICEENGMLQLIRAPTRKENLLDLLLTDIDNCKGVVSDPIADHHAILAYVKIPMPTEVTVQRDVWHFKQARWQNMRCQLRNQNWIRLKNGSVDDAVNYFVDFLTALCEKYIPRETIAHRKKSHPWLTDSCRNAIDAKNVAIDTPSFGRNNVIA